jgi:hypothetical protein
MEVTLHKQQQRWLHHRAEKSQYVYILCTESGCTLVELLPTLLRYWLDLTVPLGLPPLTCPDTLTLFLSVMVRSNKDWMERISAAAATYYVTLSCSRGTCHGADSAFRPCGDVKVTSAIQTVLLGLPHVERTPAVVCAALVDPTAEAKYRLWYGYDEDGPSERVATIALSTTVLAPQVFDTPRVMVASDVDIMQSFIKKNGKDSEYHELRQDESLIRTIMDVVTFTSWRSTVPKPLKSMNSDLKMHPKGWYEKATAHADEAAWLNYPKALHGVLQERAMAEVTHYFTRLPRLTQLPLGHVGRAQHNVGSQEETLCAVLADYWPWWETVTADAAQRSRRQLITAMKTYLFRQPPQSLEGVTVGLKHVLEAARISNQSALQPF